MANLSKHLKVLLHFVYFTFFIISRSACVLGSIDPAHRLAIEKSESIVFPKHLDLEFEHFEVFHQNFEREDGNNAFTSLDNSEFTILVSEADSDFRVVIVEVASPEKDALVGKICYVTTYIVFRPIKDFIDHYTSHIAHVRKIKGKTSIEWDFFFSKSHDFNGNFISAFAPDNEIPDKPAWQKGRMIMRRVKKKKLSDNATSGYTTESYIPKPNLPPPPTIFKGLGRCPQENELSLSLLQNQGRQTDYKIIEYILDVLQVHCLPGFYENSKKLFDMNLIVPYRGIRVSLNNKHPIMNSAFLTEQQWVDLISAVYFYSFANAFTISMNPNRNSLILNDVSPSVRNLIGMSAQMIELTATNPGLRLHLVKIVQYILITAKAANLYYKMEKDSLAGCFDCDFAASLNRNNTSKVTALINILGCKVEKLLVP